MSKPDDTDDGASIEAVAEAIDSLSDEQRHELQALSDTLGESSGDLSEDLRAAIKADEDLQREIRNLVEPSSSRRQALKGVAAGGLAGLIGGAGSAAADVDVNQSGSLDVGSVTANTYRIAGNRFGGPASARTELASELGSGDAGARYAADDTGAEYYWTGSGWDVLPVTGDELFGADIDNAASDTALIAQGDGTAAMAELYGFDPQGYARKTTNRSIGTVYQNNTGKPLLVSVRAGTGSGKAGVSLRVDDVSPPAVTVDYAKSDSSSGGKATAVGIVPDGYYYDAPFADGSLEDWVEQELTAGKVSATPTKHVEVGLSSDFSVPSGTSRHVVQWDNVYVAGPGWYDAGNYQMVIPEDGIYDLTVIFDWRNNSGWSDGDRHYVDFRVNGAVNTPPSIHQYQSGGLDTEGQDPQPGGVHFTRKAKLEANDTVGVTVNQESGSTQEIDNRRERTIFSVTGPL